MKFLLAGVLLGALFACGPARDWPETGGDGPANSGPIGPISGVSDNPYSESGVN